jgi:hypothetical protein
MRTLLILLVLALSLPAYAGMCSQDKKDKLFAKLKIKDLGHPDQHDRLVKLTHHELPVSCEIHHKGHVFTWYEDQKGKLYIIKFESGKVEEYFGPFRANI